MSSFCTDCYFLFVLFTPEVCKFTTGNLVQATEELASGVDSSFDWESEAAELRQCLVNQEGFEREQKLWSSWETSRQRMDKDAESLHDEALKSLHAVGFSNRLFASSFVRQ